MSLVVIIAMFAVFELSVYLVAKRLIDAHERKYHKHDKD